MGSFIDMTGWVMNEHGVLDSKLTVIAQAPDRINANGVHIKRWVVQCNCERHTIFVADGIALRTGNTKTCGNCERNKYEKLDEYYIGYSSNTNEKFYFDLDQYKVVEQYTWRVQLDKRNGYKRLVTTIHQDDGKVKLLTMWKLLTGYDYCDHENGNTMDNRLNNLRQSTHQLNMQNKKKYKNNSSGFIGVLKGKNGRWIANIRKDNIEYNLGVYNTKEDAILARIKAEAAVFDKEYAPNRNLFTEYNINILNEKQHWQEWIIQDKVNYLGFPIYVNSKPVVQLTLDGKFVASFETIHNASTVTGISESGIGSCCRKTAKSAGGYLWVYQDEYELNPYAFSYNPKKQGKSIVQLTVDNKYIAEYEGLSSASSALNIDTSSICACCKGKQKTAGGYKWMYKEDWNKLKLTIQNELEEADELQVI